MPGKSWEAYSGFAENCKAVDFEKDKFYGKQWVSRFLQSEIKEALVINHPG